MEAPSGFLPSIPSTARHPAVVEPGSAKLAATGLAVAYREYSIAHGVPEDAILIDARAVPRIYLAQRFRHGVRHVSVQDDAPPLTHSSAYSQLSPIPGRRAPPGSHLLHRGASPHQRFKQTPPTGAVGLSST
jgi:hypothetical protein